MTFNFADKTLLIGTDDEIIVKIIGKIKGADAYVINVQSYLDLELKNKYGFPIRQIELEWGKFNGSLAEFIVPGHDLKKI